jgi:hypothetical protein
VLSAGRELGYAEESRVIAALAALRAAEVRAAL